MYPQRHQHQLQTYMLFFNSGCIITAFFRNVNTFFKIFFVSLRASPLKIPQGALPLDPTTFEKVDKTFNCHSYRLFLDNYELRIMNYALQIRTS